MGSSEKFCLRWNDFESNISKAFREIREEKDFFDVTLTCDDDQISAHKVILSACSPFFRSVLKRNKHEHPLLYLKGVKYSDLVAVLNFMYHGEVNVAQEDLNTFLAVAEDLKVKGLTQSSENSNSNVGNNSSNSSRSAQKSKHRDPPSEASLPPVKKSRPNPPAPVLMDNDDIQEVTPVKTEPVAPPVIVQESVQSAVVEQYGTELVDAEYGEDYGDYETGYDGDSNYDGSLVDPNSTNADGNKDSSSYMEPVLEEAGDKDTWRCLLCCKVIKRKYRMKDHIESRHFVGTPCHPCSFCGRFYSTKNSRDKHISTYHKETTSY